MCDVANTRRDTSMIKKILSSLSIKLPARDLKYTEAKGPLKSLFLKWSTLSKNLLDMCVGLLPSPLDITSEKVEHLICSELKSFKNLQKQTQDALPLNPKIRVGKWFIKWFKNTYWYFKLIFLLSFSKYNSQNERACQKPQIVESIEPVC